MENYIKEGMGKSYYENGKLMYDGEWIGGKKEGIGKYFYENGSLMYHGYWIYDEEGMGTYFPHPLNISFLDLIEKNFIAVQ